MRDLITFAHIFALGIAMGAAQTKSAEQRNQSAVTKPQTPAPAISADLTSKFFKAQAEAANAQLQLEQVQKQVQAKGQVLQGVIGELQKACGEKFEPQFNPAGDPVCTAKPEVKK